MRQIWLLLSFCSWLIVPAGLLAGYLAYGLPHLIWWRSWIDTGQSYSASFPRHYTSCTYIGPFGPQTLPARQGSCVWIAFLKKTGAQDE